MTNTIPASALSLNDVHRLLSLVEGTETSFENLLLLKPLTEAEKEDLEQIRTDFRHYLSKQKLSEGLVKFLVIAPLLRLAGFYCAPVEIFLEEPIAEIQLESEDILIKGRMDLLALQRQAATSFWILVIETKQSIADPWVGLPQLLTYAYQGLQNQTTVWGLVTNGLSYQFVHLQQGAPNTYRLLPLLSILTTESANQILQVLKAICSLLSDSKTECSLN